MGQNFRIRLARGCPGVHYRHRRPAVCRSGRARSSSACSSNSRRTSSISEQVQAAGRIHCLGSRNRQGRARRAGQISHYQGFTTDITERKQAEEALEKQKIMLEHLSESSPEAIAVVDNQARVLLINKSFANLFWV